ncbi:GNAT family N-acetyltransferase [Pontibacter sp. 172403-2]|uniref:GNAT family N-acetyltransferase n=1 Tax=Pontibacter rufus TaxID=2791028 RepID=UPI0018AF5EF8|nr:GNAT family N-acetyltransferase [Pontibacter sp. 172403-2]MBF9253310.1 GNAT family N-acetyltransferase [Pontibacter sp. 172403-2]
MGNNFYITTDKDQLDIDLIVDFLQNKSYWASARNRETIERSINNSFCFGVFDENRKQVAFARVITDFAVYAWLLDVFVLEEYRGKSLGKLLMQNVFSHPDLQGLKRWGLATNNAHSLYKKFGFTSLSNPEIMMEKINM